MERESVGVFLLFPHSQTLVYYLDFMEREVTWILSYSEWHLIQVDLSRTWNEIGNDSENKENDQTDTASHFEMFSPNSASSV